MSHFIPGNTKLIWNYAHLGGMYIRLSNDEEALKNIEILLAYMKKHNDPHGYIRGLVLCMGLYARQGNWRDMLRIYRDAVDIADSGAHASFALSETLVSWKVAWSWIGRYSEGESDIRRGRKIHDELGYRGYPYVKAATGYILGMQEKYDEALKLLNDELRDDDGSSKQIDQSSESATLTVFGAVLLRNGEVAQAKKSLLDSLRVRKEIKAERDYIETYFWLGRCCELDSLVNTIPSNSSTKETISYYEIGASLRAARRYYFTTGCLDGLIR